MIERSLADGILTLRMAHGKANALDIELVDALLQVLENGTAEARAVVLTGTGSIFSAGVDLIRVTQGGADYVKQFLPRFATLVGRLFAFPKPLVAAVNGHAIAGGCVLALTADVRLLADGAGKIGVPELLVGVPFPAAALEVVRHGVPPDRAPWLIYTGKTVPAREACVAGFMGEVVAPEQLQARARELAAQLAQIPPQVFGLTKQSLRAEALQRIEAGSERYDPIVIELWAAPETRERIQEYLRKTLRK